MDDYTVDLYSPLPQLREFHLSRALWRLCIGSNRSGKTLAAAVEFARAVLGRDPYEKYPKTDGVALVIGLDTEHLGMLWRKLYLPGAIKTIVSQGKHRSLQLEVSGNDVSISAKDMMQRESWRDAPPLIPHDAISGIGWYDRARYIPQTVVLRNNWRLLFVSSRGAVKQGEHYDLVWIDEQIQRPEFFYEAYRGLVGVNLDRRGYGIWSATGQKQNPLLYNLAELAKNDPRIQVYKLDIAQNPFLDFDDVERFAAILPENERRVRIDGRFAIESWIIYPEFDAGVHVVKDMKLNPDWTAILALDPGTTRCATVMAAVDRDDNIYVYDCVLQEHGNARVWAHALANRGDAESFEWWVIDTRAGRTHGMGSEITVADMYYKAASELGIRPRVHGGLAGFVPGCDDPAVRREILRRYLTRTKENEGKGRIYISESCGALIHQIKMAQFDEKNPRKRIGGSYDLLDALEYLVAMQPRYVQRPAVKRTNVSISDYVRRRNVQRSGYPIGIG